MDIYLSTVDECVYHLPLGNVNEWANVKRDLYVALANTVCSPPASSSDMNVLCHQTRHILIGAWSQPQSGIHFNGMVMRKMHTRFVCVCVCAVLTDVQTEFLFQFPNQSSPSAKKMFRKFNEIFDRCQSPEQIFISIIYFRCAVQLLVGLLLAFRLTALTLMPTLNTSTIVWCWLIRFFRPKTNCLNNGVFWKRCHNQRVCWAFNELSRSLKYIYTTHYGPECDREIAQSHTEKRKFGGINCCCWWRGWANINNELTDVR